MPTIERPSGIRVHSDGDLTLQDLPAMQPESSTGPRRRTRAIDLPAGPVPLGPDNAAPATDPVVSSMQEQDLVLIDSFEMAPAAPTPGTRRAAPQAGPKQITADISTDDDAAVLLEQDGMYSWQFPASATPIAATRRRGPVIEPPRKRVAFDITIPAAPDRQRRRSLGPIADFAIDRVRVFVFKFVARVAAKTAIGFLERNITPGLVLMDSDDPTAWRSVSDLAEIALPLDRPARILLFVHGTFSTTKGSFGALGASQWGRKFLQTARTRYDAIIGYEHPTLSVTPLENANDLLARLERASLTMAPHIDAVSYSRGALVLRSLMEYLLPKSRLGTQIRRAIFVGGTNGGTKLAAPANWARLIDIWTNLSAAGCRALSVLGPPALAATILNESIQSLGALVKYLAAEVGNDRSVPGLAAMRPDGPFIREINKAQRDQPTPLSSFYCVVTSNFDLRLFDTSEGARELPGRFVKWALDGVLDSLMKEANDLVVHTRAMSEIDPVSGDFVKDRLEFQGNAHVYHTVYFTRPEVAAALTKWLELGTPSAAARALPAAAAADIVTVNAADAYGTVRRTIARREPEYVVVERHLPDETLRYAFRPSELVSVGAAVSASAVGESQSLESALEFDKSLELHEDRASTDSRAPAAGPGRDARSVTARRRIVMEGATPVGVIGSLAAPPSIAVLAKDTPAARAAAPPPKEEPTAPAPAPSGASPARPTRRTRGGVLPPAAPAPQPTAPETAARTEPATWNAAAWMPEIVPLKKTVDLEVTLSRDEIRIAAGMAAARATVTVDPSKRLVIHVVPKQNVDVVGDTRVELDVSAQSMFTMAFPIRGTSEGPAEIWVRVMQGPLVLANLILKPSVAARVPKSVNRVRAADVARTSEAPIARYPVLQIFELVNGSCFSFRFTLDMGDGAFLLGTSKPIRVDRSKYVADLYKKIETYWVSSDGDAKKFEREMRTYGGTLYDELIPQEVQVALWNARDTLKAIQVVSEEPFIPWEIVHLKAPQQPGAPPPSLPAQEHFLATKGLVRWLHNRGPAPAAIIVRNGHAFYVVPKYPQQYDLPAAQEEIPFLKDELRATALDGDSNRVIDALRNAGSIDLLHFSGHGAVDAQDPTTARVMLGGRIENATYIPDYLKASEVQQNAVLTGTDGNRPLVFLNACQSGRLGWNLTELGGFAEAFLRTGVGAFVGTLWEAGDVQAKHFGMAFYQALKEGKTLAEAALAGRQAARSHDEATWLAYVVYGYPTAKVTYA